VSLIASEYESGMSPDEIIEAHPHLTLAQVHAALSYFYDNRAAIHAEWEEARQLLADLQLQYPSERSPN
jgi:uncharacterized protein (DUF433 family)